MANVKNKPLTSIVMLAYDQIQLMRNITTLAIEAIVKFTDEEDYELILVDTIPEGAEKLTLTDTFGVFQMGEREDRIWIKQYLKDMKNPGQYGSYNIGAKQAKGDYLCFIQNDVIVTEGWLDTLKYYLDNKKAEVVQPVQFPRTREFIKKMYSADFDDAEVVSGSQDAGLTMMTRDIFNKVGGWDAGYKMFWGEKRMYNRLRENGVVVTGVMKANILHVNSATYLQRLETEPKKQTDDINDSGKHDEKVEGRL